MLADAGMCFTCPSEREPTFRKGGAVNRTRVCRVNVTPLAKGHSDCFFPLLAEPVGNRAPLPVSSFVVCVTSRMPVGPVVF